MITTSFVSFSYICKSLAKLETVLILQIDVWCKWNECLTEWGSSPHLLLLISDEIGKEGEDGRLGLCLCCFLKSLLQIGSDSK